MKLTRRRFCATLPVATVASLLPTVYTHRAAWAAPAISANPTFAMIATADRVRTLAAARRYVNQPIQTVTSFVTNRSPGGPHDFFSQADYFWPNPRDPNGPYINRDGQSNPDNFSDHRKAMIRLSIEMPALTSAWLMLRSGGGDKALAIRYAQHAADHLRAWFIHPKTRMNPNLEFSQGVKGISTGRNFGIIDTLHLVEVARAAALLAPMMMSQLEVEALHAWFREYLHWMKTSDKGMKERDTLNNHAVCWALQAAEFARLIGDQETRDEVRTQYRTLFLPNQLGSDGSFPRELSRTKPYSYSIFNFDVMAALCQSLDEPESAHAPDLFAYQLPDGRGICKAAAFLFPYLEDKGCWPYAHDVEHFDSFPVRSPGLLFCGVHCSRPEYLQVWRHLDPDPVDPEVIRNYPVRQPLLWFA